MLFETQLTLLIVASIIPDMFSMHHGGKDGKGDGRKGDSDICGMSEECRKASMKCESLVKEMTCAEKDEKEKIMEKCYSENGLQENYETFFNDLGKYLSYPTKHFMEKLMKDDPKALDGVNCCMVKENGAANDEGFVDLEKVAMKLISRAKDDQLRNAIEQGRQNCPAIQSCDIMAVKKCFIEECRRFLTA